jgi:superfamily II DNA or RNA helicase
VVSLTEDLLIKAAGWPVFKEARGLHAAGWVQSAEWAPPLLRGTGSIGGKTRSAGLRILGPTDVENLCSCPEARRGLICAHAVAVGLQVLRPAVAKIEQISAPPSSSPPAKTSAAEAIRRGGEAAFAPTIEEPKVRLELEGSWRELRGRLDFSYSEEGVRNDEAELRVLREVAAAGFTDRQGEAVLSGEEATLRFFAVELPRWQERWEVVLGERFAHVSRQHVRLQPRVVLQPAAGNSDWLDFRLHYTAGAAAVLSAEDLRELLAGGKRTLSLQSGQTAVLSPEEAEDWEEVLRDCDPERTRGGWRIPVRCAGYVEETAQRWGARPAGAAAAKKKKPWSGGALFSRLRPYQQTGARWLAGLAEQGLGGLLADEMGLGKTLQALAVLETLPGRSLVVCPSSLVWNWTREAARFCPNLRVTALDGPRRDRVWAERERYQVLVTSYALLRRDGEKLAAEQWDAVVLDEAQHIKNPESQNAKAAAALTARARFVLTGTPVENSLRDLWSLFAFLLPGYLGTRKDFQERYEQPLLAGGAVGEVWERLQRRIGPYVLRRRKAEILPELPPKIEQILEIDLGPRQRRLYDQLQEAARQQLDDLRRGQSGAARMKVLTALLRLRQCCCDARLLGAPVPEDDAAVEGKLGALLELLDEVVDGGHRVLLFSQFTSMLDLIGEALREREVAWLRLDGSTKNRGEVVEKFQKRTGPPVFLISLKAGGVGLNLTAADTVIHFDPWWNPSVEAQATDRAHRIGQQQVVTSIKLIARDTVEARVLRLQESKRELLRSTLDAEAAWAGLDEADLASLLE